MKNKDLAHILKNERINKGETLHQVAVSTNIDSTLISKIERGDRLPTMDQVKMLANHFNLSIDQLCSKLVAERIIKDYGRSQTTFQAVQMVKEELAQYGRNKQEKK